MNSALFLNPEKNDSYYRSILPSHYLSKICGIKSNYFWIKDINCINSYDIVVIKNIFDLSFVELVKSFGKKIIYDIDIDIFNIPKDHKYYCFYKNKKVSEILDIIRASDILTVNSKRLFKVYRKFNNHIWIIPDYIDLDSWQWSDVRNNPKNNIGIAVPRDYKTDINYILKGIEKLSKEFDVNVKFFGYMPEKTEIKNNRLVCYNSMSDYINAREKEQCGIVLCPLSPSKFNLSRSHIAILESWASHSLVIATNWGTYARMIHDGNGFLVNKDKSWFDKFKYVFEHYDKLSKSVLSKSQSYLIKYDIKVNIHKWKQALMRLNK